MELLELILLVLCGCFLVSQAEYANSGGEITIRHSDSKDVYEANNGFKCPFPFGAFPDPDDCGNFYACVAGIHVHRRCKTLQHFDVLRRKCLPFIIAICGHNGKTTTSVITATATETTPSEKSFKCPSFSGSHPHPEDCSKYYTCIFFIPTEKTCPAKQLFDAVKKECKPEDHVHCGNRLRPGFTTTSVITETDSEITETATETSTEITVTESTREDIQSVSTDITGSIAEDITTKVRPTGPPDTDCHEDDVDCIIDKTGDVDDWFTCPEDVGAYEHPSSNKLFIFCMNWEPSVKKCGMDLIFSKELSTCVEMDHFM